jgi:hypothetical protein
LRAVHGHRRVADHVAGWLLVNCGFLFGIPSASARGNSLFTSPLDSVIAFRTPDT